MKVAFDTSVLVAGSVAGHVHEERARVWFRAARESRIVAIATTHAFAETWATLTAIPVVPRIAPGAAERVIDRLVQHIEPVAIGWEDYRLAVQRCGDRSLRSGALYDALHLMVASREGAEVFLTSNTRDFVALAGEESPRILAPPDPPALLES